MFVENLKREQINEFVRKHLAKDFHPEVPGKYQVEIAWPNGEEAKEVHYCSKTFVRHISVYLMDDRMMPLVSKELENAWIKYLYSIFGEEYKEWYMAEKAKLFE